MIIAVSAFCVSFIYIFVKAFQQLNVMKAEYMWMVPTSVIMAACEVFIIGTAALSQQWWIFLPIGVGGGTGCMLSVYVHSKLKERKRD